MSAPPLITLTTDFGTASPYVATMKGVILSVNPAARLHDLTHTIRAQDLHHANYFLVTAVPYFPPGTVHVCIVDPGVGSERAALVAESGGQLFVGPDNGIFTSVFRKLGGARCRRLANSRFWRPGVSSTFHGRDIFAPVAAHLSLGVTPDELGPELTDPAQLPTRSAVTFGKKWQGEVQFADDFGNLITNIPACKLKCLPVKVSVESGAKPLALRWVRTYSDAAAGDLVCLFSSDGYFEIAEVNGNAARRLGVVTGAAVELEWE
jgi:S-adenosylmethionine hydrolase